MADKSGEDGDTGLIKYLRDNNIDDLRGYIDSKIKENTLKTTDLVTIAKVNNDTAGLIKEMSVNLNQVDDTEVANQISKEIIADIETYADHHLKKYQKYTLNAPLLSSSISESTAQFFNLISLLKDVSVLGRKLLESAPQFNAQTPQNKSPSLSDRKSSSSTQNRSKQQGSLGKRDEDSTSDDLLAALIESSSSDDFLVLSSSLDSISTKDMIVAALIYIKSHECFTLSHDIQGVVMVLRRTKFMIINILAQKNQMELITKLLTSIGRYSEMNYVFDLFRDRNQFEILLSKGVEKTPELRIALFNYVKKNPEFYPLVTLNFSMFREIAESLEASAIKRLNKVILGKKKVTTTTTITTTTTSSTTNTTTSATTATTTTTAAGSRLHEIDSNELSSSGKNCNNDSKNLLYPKESLNLSLVELIDASDCFAKAGCYKRSNYCERKAKLIALQLAILPSGTNALELQQSELNDLIVSFESFTDAYIVAEAYDYHLAWRQALFKNVILRGHSVYLENYCKKCDLSSVLVEELVLLYKQYTSNSNKQISQEESSNLAKAMKMLLVKLADVELKCKIYSQLNFDDATEELLRNQAIQAHLKDLKLA